MIPKLHYVSQGGTAKEHLENIQKACNSGAELVQLDFKHSSEKKFLAAATEAREITSHFQTRLIITDDYKVARAVKSDGVVITDTSISFLKARIHLYTWQSIGARAHTLEDCNKRIEDDVDYIHLGPLKDSEIYKNSVGDRLGLTGYTVILDILKTNTPILAFGGILTQDVKALLEAGISGIAVSSAITQDFNSIKYFNELLGASSTEEKRHTFE